MAKIVINHLGSIHHIEMDIKRVNIFIGEQATGKSTLCKAVYFFRNLKEVLLDYYYTVGQDGKSNKGLIKELSSRLKDSFVSLFGYSWQLPDDLSMEYYYSDEHSIKINLMQERKKYISVKYSKMLLNELHGLDRYAGNYYNSITAINGMSILTGLENKKFYEYLETEISRILEDDMTTYYIPAGRGLLSLLCNQKTYLNYGELDPINRKFMQTIETLQPKFADGTARVSNYYPLPERKFSVEKMSEEIIHGMKGEYFCQKGREYLQIENSDEKVAINFTSSGQQEILWLYNQLYVLMLKDEKAFVIIEEPEAHLYPILQKNIMDFIVKYLNITGGAAIITTHSPYILTETNNLCVIGKVKCNDKIRKNVEKLVGKWSYITTNELNAYKLSNASQGTEVRSLLDVETGELLAEEIDEISQEINEIYSKLFYFEEGIFNEEN